MKRIGHLAPANLTIIFVNPINALSRVLSPVKFAILPAVLAAATAASAQTNPPVPVLQIKADQVTTPVSPMLHGLMTEEINYSYEGGIYAELIRNRTFKANPSVPVYWNTVGGAAMALDKSVPLNDALAVSLRLDAGGASPKAPAGIANHGYWGIPLRPRTRYHVSFYAKAAGGFAGLLTASLADAGGTTLARADVTGLTSDWKKFELDLETRSIKPSKDNVFKLTIATPGTLWFQQVSLFPPTYHNRANGNRPDIMELLAAMHPKFLRLPGGNYLEGDHFNERFDWKKSIGDIAQRPGHRSPWNYWSTDGMGLLEYLDWCEDLHMEPLLAVFAGYSLQHDYVKPGTDLAPYVQDALDEIQYVAGDTNTPWGARRAQDGHPTPFPLHYVEVGNEDSFDRSGSYGGRFKQFFDAIKAEYPTLQIIATTPVKSCVPDLVDEHYYKSEAGMEDQANMYDTRPRGGKTRVFVGEWATRAGSPTPNMAAALGDAAWMCCLERNSDLVVMHSYAPLLVNVSDLGLRGSMQWASDLIGYDALTSYGSPSYYAQVLFSSHHGNEVLATGSQNIPTYNWYLPASNRQTASGRQVPSLFFDATRDSTNGTIYLKVVNCAAAPQPVNIEISGVTSVAAKGVATVIKAEKHDETNSLANPRKIVPVGEKVRGLGARFTRTFPPYSITVLELKAR
jgi:alpha-N-arabinofuranosidase